ncbi:DcaP family trimeric outer membrane transporter [Amphritea sp. HPY]|uniref:DcaP family trimeric outer membrane transporter n=1 Tax=Amphritea sp. HPY TaxID=3421652 RepID=UPI003D7EFCB4
MNYKNEIRTIAGLSICLASTMAHSFEPFQVGNTSVKIGGYIKADLIHSDVSQSLSGLSVGDELIAAGFIPLEGTAKADKKDTRMNARESRLIISTETPRASGALKTRFEGDFYGSDGTERFSNSHNFRMRIAWAEFGKWGVGQNWSSMIIFPSLAEQNNFSGLTGGPSALRQPAFRYTDGPFQVSLENPETTLTNLAPGPGSLTTSGDGIPDLFVRYNMKGESHNTSVVGIGRQLTDSAGDNSTVGFGLVAGGNIKINNSKDQFKWFAAKGAVGRFVGGNFFADAEPTSSGSIDALDTTAINLAYQHWWTSNIRSTLQYSYTEADNSDYVKTAATGSVNKEATSMMANVMWNISPQTRAGIEISNTERVVEGGSSGDLNRIQFSIKQSF